MKKEKRKGFFENEIVVFLLGPIILLLVVKFTGYQIFYSGKDSREKEKTVLLLSFGALFYLIMIIVLAWSD